MSPEERAQFSTSDALANRGTKLHAAWENDSTEGLLDDEVDDLVDDFIKGKKYCESAIAQWATDNRIPVFQEAAREQRFWLHNPSDLTPALSGQIDRYFLAGRHALLLDYKSGWTPNLSKSDENWQLRVYAVLLWKEHPELERIRVGFVKPKDRYENADYTDYDVSDLEHSEREIHHILWKTKQPDAIRSAGTHCNWCIAKAYCVEAASMSLLPTVMAGVVTDRKAWTPEEIAAKLSPEDLSAIHSLAGTIVKNLEAVKLRLKSIPETHLAEMGWMLADGRKTDTIIETKSAFDHIKGEMQISDKELWNAMSFGKADLILAIQRDTGVSKEKAAGYVSQIVSKYGETKQSEKALKRL
jgi:hypothetical protein